MRFKDICIIGDIIQTRLMVLGINADLTWTEYDNGVQYTLRVHDKTKDKLLDAMDNMHLRFSKELEYTNEGMHVVR